MNDSDCKALSELAETLESARSISPLLSVTEERHHYKRCIFKGCCVPQSLIKKLSQSNENNEQREEHWRLRSACAQINNTLFQPLLCVCQQPMPGNPNESGQQKVGRWIFLKEYMLQLVCLAHTHQVSNYLNQTLQELQAFYHTI